MDGDGPLLLDAEVQELLDDVRGRHRAVVKVQVVVPDPCALELAAVVGVGLVKPHHRRHLLLLENLDVIFRGEGVDAWAELLALGGGALEGEELGVVHMEVAVKGVVPEFIVVHVKILGRVPPEINRLSEGGEAVEEGEGVVRRKVRRVPEGFEGVGFDNGERERGRLRRPLVAQYQVRSYEKGCVRSQCYVLVRVVDEVAVGESGVGHALGHQRAKAVHDAKVNGPEVCAVRLVSLLQIRRKEKQCGLTLDFRQRVVIVAVSCERQLAFDYRVNFPHCPWRFLVCAPLIFRFLGPE
mmetsp:Transcript_11864/g.28374  ORF Transcript_11864/g.28374 Transcript_11864/m.28374 type:complete len:297 (-) Transcript_11864:280-1170(-)